MSKSYSLITGGSFGIVFIALILSGLGCGAPMTTTTSTITTETTTSTTTSTTTTSTSTTSTSTTTSTTTTTLAVGSARYCYEFGVPGEYLPTYHLVGIKAWLSDNHGTGTAGTMEAWDYFYSDSVTFEVPRVDGLAYRIGNETEPGKITDLYNAFSVLLFSTAETWPIDSTQAMAIFRAAPIVVSWESGKDVADMLDIIKLEPPLTASGSTRWIINFDYGGTTVINGEIDALTGELITAEIIF